ncbi:MAG: UvrD-helicase domain-containing protein, partial [Caulobacteraceae bacterium]|nr:UvrD-helicase domain-containing protein [Caulobacter sp.]
EGPLGRAYAHLAAELDLRSFEALLAAFEAQREAVGAYARQCAELGRSLEDDVWRRAGFPDAPADPEALEEAAALECDWTQWRAASSALALTGASTDAKLSGRLAQLAECAATSPAGFADCWSAFATKGGEPLKQLGTKGVGADTLAWLKREQERLHATCQLAAAARQARDTVQALVLATAYASFYAGEKAAEGALDFADLVARAGELLTVRADAAWVLFKLDGGIEHLLLDEAQDTAPEQWTVLDALTDEFLAGEGARPRRELERGSFVVGDPKQSIYSFQGADPNGLLARIQGRAARAEAAGRAFKGVDLVESWRSTPQVLAFVDAVFSNPAARLLDPPLGDEVVHHVVGGPRRDHAGCVDLWPPFQDEPREEADAWDAPLDAPAPQSAVKRLAARIASATADMIARGEAVFDKAIGERGDWRPMHAGDVLVLVRRRDALFEEILRALKKRRIPVAGADRLRLSDHALFADVRALLRFALYPWDDLTVAELLRSPFCDVDEGGLYDLAQPRPERAQLWAELNRRAQERPEWAAAKAFLAQARAEAQAGRTPFDWLGRVLSALDGRGLTVRQRLLTRLGAEAEDALEALLAEALAAEGRGVRDLERFCAELERAEIEVKRELEGAGAEVRVMTVHGAKGLEAPVVILPDTLGRAPERWPPLLATGDGGLVFAPRGLGDTPASRAAKDGLKAKQAQEGLRLLYVALTRARDRLIVCGRLPGNVKAPPADSWYALVAEAFEQEGIAGEVHVVADGDLHVRRYGPDPRPALALTAEPRPGPATPAWLTAPPPPEPGLAALSSPSRQAERLRGPAPSPLAAVGTALMLPVVGNLMDLSVQDPRQMGVLFGLTLVGT